MDDGAKTAFQWAPSREGQQYRCCPEWASDLQASKVGYAQKNTDLATLNARKVTSEIFQWPPTQNKTTEDANPMNVLNDTAGSDWGGDK